MCASALKRVVCVGAVSRLHFSGVHSHVHVVNAQLAMEVFVNIASKPHSLRGEEERQQEPFFLAHQRRRPRTRPAAYLALLDGFGCRFFQQLDGLIVVQRTAGPNHVTKELNGVQLPVLILGSGVIHKADLWKQKNFWNGM